MAARQQGTKHTSSFHPASVSVLSHISAANTARDATGVKLDPLAVTATLDNVSDPLLHDVLVQHRSAVRGRLEAPRGSRGRHRKSSSAVAVKLYPSQSDL